MLWLWAVLVGSWTLPSTSRLFLLSFASPLPYSSYVISRYVRSQSSYRQMDICTLIQCQRAAYSVLAWCVILTVPHSMCSSSGRDSVLLLVRPPDRSVSVKTHPPAPSRRPPPLTLFASTGPYYFSWLPPLGTRPYLLNNAGRSAHFCHGSPPNEPEKGTQRRV